MLGLNKPFENRQRIKEVDIEYMSDTSAAMMQGAPIRYHLILWAAVAFLVIAGIWASFATLDVVTTGEGRVIPSSNIQKVQNLEGGIIKDIRVRVGMLVEKGEVLMVIDDTRFSSSFREMEVQLNALQAKMARLQAETQGVPPEFPKDVVENYPQYYQSELSLYKSRLDELEVRRNILQDQVEQKAQELIELQGKREQVSRSLNLVKRELELTRPLVSEGAVSEVELLRLERSVNDLAGELESTELAIPRAESSKTSAERKLSELDISFKTEAITELNQVKAEHERLLESIKAQEDRVLRTVIRAPARGTVNQVYVNTIGQIIQPGEDLIDIVPLNDTLLIEANVRPSDIGFLRPNLPATVKISAYDFSIYGGLKAQVEFISADTITDERGESFYQIHVRTTDLTFLVGKKGERLEIIPGMSASVDILTGQRTVLEYLLKPILKAKSNALRER